MAVQPTDPSIVNFLTSRGFQPTGGERAPLFGQRKSIFESLGLGTDFRGEAGQNTAILNRLTQFERDKGVQLSPTNLPDFLRATPPTTGTAPPAGTPPAPSQVPNYLRSLATQAISQDQTPVLPSADETAKLALEKFTGGATFPLQVESVEAEKSQVRLEGQQQAEKFIRNIASRGLIFSGAKTQGVSDIEVDTLAKTLNVDRRFAMLIATGLQNAAQDIVKQAQKEIEDSKKEGKEQRTEARDALKALGYVIDPGTGTLIRSEESLRKEQADKLSIVREERLQESELFDREISLANLEARQASLGLQAHSQSRLDALAGLAFTKFETDQAQHNAMVEGELTNFLNGGIGLLDISDSIRGEVTNYATNFIKTTEFVGADGVTKKLDVAKKLGTSVDFTDNEWRAAIYDNYVRGDAYDDVLNLIATEPIANKDRGKLIASEIYQIGKGAPDSGKTGRSPLGLAFEGAKEVLSKNIDYSKLNIPSLFRF